MIVTVAAIASVLLLGQSGASPPPTPPSRRFDTTILSPAPPAGTDWSRRLRPRGNPMLWATTDHYPSLPVAPAPLPVP